MNPDDYQKQALVTEHTPDFVRLFDRKTGEPMSADHNMMVARLLHAQLGIASEAGELADALKKHIIYGAALDEVNVVEETGDLTWYEALACAAVKGHLADAMARNIAKLKARFGAKFSEAAALVRDLGAERKVLEGGGAGGASVHTAAAQSLTLTIPQTINGRQVPIAVRRIGDDLQLTNIGYYADDVVVSATLLARLGFTWRAAAEAAAAAAEPSRRSRRQEP